MADDITLGEKERRFDEALNKLQRTVDAGIGVLVETLDEFLGAPDARRQDPRYKAWTPQFAPQSCEGEAPWQNKTSQCLRLRSLCCA